MSKNLLQDKMVSLRALILALYLVLQHEEAGALYARMRFLRSVYMGLVSVQKHEVGDAKRHFIAAKEQIKQISGTFHLGSLQENENNNLMGGSYMAIAL